VEDDNELVARCLKRDTAAEYALYRRFAPKMYGICVRYGGNETEANEILQTGFIRVFNSLPKYRSEGSLEGWIRRIFVNTAIRYNKATPWYNKSGEMSNEDEFSKVHEPDAMNWSVQECLEVIQQLPVELRTVFNMYAIEDYKHEEIADMLGLSAGTARSQLARARRMIRRLLSERRKK
jgi:RNA polymerase sigma factor (sigma-70 family)